MERIAISGSHGFIGRTLGVHFPDYERLNRSGDVPEDLDCIFDLAAFGNMSEQLGDHLEIYQANLIRVIKEFTQIDQEKYIYISTSSVKLPTQTAYSLSKKAAEDYIRSSGKNVAIVRPYTIIGLGEQKEHLIPKLINSCLYGVEMPFVSSPVHDFLDVQDLADALLVIKAGGLFEGEIYEVGSGIQTSNERIKEIVENLIGSKANLKYVDSMRAYDTKDWVANNERIYSLGWQPKKTLEQTIGEMVEYARANKTNK